MGENGIMDNNFLKPFITLFGIGAAITLAKSLKSKKPLKEVIAECIIGGAVSVGASTIYIFYPTVPFIAVAGLGCIAAILGVAFLSDLVEDAIDKYLKGSK